MRLKNLSRTPLCMYRESEMKECEGMVKKHLGGL